MLGESTVEEYLHYDDTSVLHLYIARGYKDFFTGSHLQYDLSFVI